jgi:hypothetical protein
MEEAEKEKDKIIRQIARRILDEHRKHQNLPDNMWARIAAGKIYMSHISPTPPEIIPVKEGSFDELFPELAERYVINFSSLPRKIIEIPDVPIMQHPHVKGFDEIRVGDIVEYDLDKSLWNTYQDEEITRRAKELNCMCHIWEYKGKTRFKFVKE